MKFQFKINIFWILGSILMIFGTWIVMKTLFLGYYGSKSAIVQVGILSVWIMDALFIWMMLDRSCIVEEDHLKIKYGCFLNLHLNYEDIFEFHEVKRLPIFSHFTVNSIAISFKPRDGRSGIDVIHISPKQLETCLEHLKANTMVTA